MNGRASAEPIPLTQLATGRSGRVVSVPLSPGSRLVRLQSLGLVPGASVELIQTQPTAIFRVDETTVALETEIADGILVEPLEA